MTSAEVYPVAAGAATPELEQALTVPADLGAAAFFDVDNTMMIGASIFHFAKGLAARDFFDWTDLLRFGLRQARLRVRGESKDDMHNARDSALAFVAGKEVDEIVRLGEEIYDETMAGKIWSGTNALAQMHLDAGQRVWLVTATPQELARIIADRLKLTGALGTVAETSDGRYTGRLVGDVLHGEAKAAAVRALAEAEGLDLARCTAYSDSINDVPMLSLVGTAVAVNPDSDLRAEAKRRGWVVKDFRTGRKAARVGVPAALGLGAVAGAVVAGAAARRAYNSPTSSLAPRTRATKDASAALLAATVQGSLALGTLGTHAARAAGRSTVRAGQATARGTHTAAQSSRTAARATRHAAQRVHRQTERRFTSSR